jgi:phytoene dehydrogenase-like protein
MLFFKGGGEMHSFNEQKSEARCFALIIGGGLGGLAAGAKLARSGKKVFLIEQNDSIGGFARVIHAKNFVHEFSLHQLSGFEEGNLLREIFGEFGLFDQLEFVKLPNFYRSAIGKIHVTLPHSLGHAAAILLEEFPSEAKGIRKFFDVLTTLNKEVNRWIRRGCDSKFLYPLYPLLYPRMVRYAKTSVGKFLDAITKNDELKLIFAALLPWYHDDPYTTSLIAFAYGQASYFIGGGYYVKGGSQRLSNALGSIITDNGGVIMLEHVVTGITIKDGRACGVVYKDLHESGKETKLVFGDCIIANAAIPHVAHDLLPPPANKKLIKKIRSQRPSISFLSVYLKFRRSLAELGNQCYCTIIGDKRWTTFAQFAEACKIDDYHLKGMGFTDYSIIDNGMLEESRYSGVLVVVDSLRRWEGLSAVEYEKRKELAAGILINRLEAIVPGVKEEIEGYDVVTPRTLHLQTKNPAGTPYGFAQIPSQLGLHRMGNASPVKRLYFASAWSRPGAAYIGTICGGYNCAKRVLREVR